jgi:BirA family biotin operon repressor/biotin-[acetyl-CoA-carboxylase] ligase
VTRLIVASATALARAIRLQTGLPAEIKWPNDILIRGKKVAGILTELSGEVEQVHYVILGIGVDVNLTQSDLPPDLRKIATSLRIEAGQILNRAALALEILRQLDADYQKVHDDGFEQLAQEWASNCCTLGCEVTIQTGDRTISGRAESLDTEGSLLVRTRHGHLERVVGGDVQLAK